LRRFAEPPLGLSCPGTRSPPVSSFRARISESREEISYRLRYADLEGNITQAHIHLGGAAQSGGIRMFLCSTLADPPAGTPACPAAPGEVSGTLEPRDVIGPAEQGIDPGEFDELVDAIRAGVTYANVHTSKYPGGEIRAQLEGDDDRDSDD
jgi:hypothetical protein